MCECEIVRAALKVGQPYEYKIYEHFFPNDSVAYVRKGEKVLIQQEDVKAT